MSTATMGTATATGTTTAAMIFLSYRRDDSGGHVGRLYDALSARFGSQRLFVDIDHINAGQDFVQVVDEAVARCAVLLVVIGKRWAGSGRIGKRRIDNPGDFVRLEVAGGLRRQGLRVIPVLVGGATMPGPTELPDDIKDLARRNAFELSDTRWKEDVARLIAQLDQTMGPAATPRISLPSLPKAIKLPTAIPASLPSWGKWVGGAAVVLVLALLVRGVAGHRSPTVPTVPAVAVSQIAIPADPAKALPSGVPDAAERSVGDARREWRPDAVLTQITARLHTPSNSAASYELDYALRSPTDGDGLQIVTGIPGAQPASKPLSPIARPAIHALPSTFVDLPAAVQAARDAGLVGDVHTGLLSASFVERRGQPTWRLVGDGDTPVYVDGTSGAVLHGSFTLASGSGSGSTHGENPIQALKGLFHHH